MIFSFGFITIVKFTSCFTQQIPLFEFHCENIHYSFQIFVVVARNAKYFITHCWKTYPGLLLVYLGCDHLSQDSNTEEVSGRHSAAGAGAGAGAEEEAGANTTTQTPLPRRTWIAQSLAHGICNGHFSFVIHLGF